MNSILCYIPDISYKKMIPHYNKRWEEKYLFLMHSIVFQQLRNMNSFNGYVNLDSTLLKKLIGDHYYKNVLNQLINAGIVQPLIANGKVIYSAGAFSKAYRINPLMFENTRIKAVPVTKKTYVRKIANVRTAQYNEAIKLNPNLAHEFLMLTYRKIHVEKALEYVNKNYIKNSPQYNARIASINEFDSMHKINKHSSFENTEWNKETFIPFHFSYNKGRVYSPASNLPVDLEQFTYFIGYEKENSICLDLPNSQLCFFEELINSSSNRIGISNTGGKIENKMHHIGREGNEEEEGIEKMANSSSIPPPVPSSSLCGANFSTQNTWKTIIHKGLGYECIMCLSKWKNKDSNHTKEERQEFKKEFFGQLFYNRFIPNYLTPLEETFKLHFPNEARRLRGVKKQLGNKLLAIQVQKLEGKFFHDICVYYLKTKYKDIPFTIKHDSITIPQSEGAFLIPELNNLVNEFFNDSEFNFKVETL